VKDVCSKSVFLGCQRLFHFFLAFSKHFGIFFGLSISRFFDFEELLNFVHGHIKHIGFEFEGSLHLSEIVCVPLLGIYLSPLRGVYRVEPLPFANLTA
jgi:hypothetical protein